MTVSVKEIKEEAFQYAKYSRVLMKILNYPYITMFPLKSKNALCIKISRQHYSVAAYELHTKIESLLKEYNVHYEKLNEYLDERGTIVIPDMTPEKFIVWCKIVF